MFECDIVIIDTGIELKHSVFNNSQNNIYTFEVKKEDSLHMVNQCTDKIGHGTAVAGIILSKSPDAKVCVIKIFENDFYVDPEYLIFALKFIENSIKCKIINLSLGIPIYLRELEDVCYRLINKGYIIISAFDNEGVVSYPAAFDFVVGVEASYKCRKMEQIIIMNDSMVNILAYGYSYRVAWINNSYLFMRGNSFSTAYVTAMLFNLIKKQKKLSASAIKIPILLKKLATAKYQNVMDVKIANFSEEHIFPIKNAAIFPYNKEMNSVVNFSHMLFFNLKHVYDIRQHGKVNSVIKRLQSGKEYLIENIDDIVWKDIDTLIIGHLDQITAVSTENIKVLLLKKCIKNNINVYLFDVLNASQFVTAFKKRGLKISCPNIKKVEIKNKLGKLYSISAPVLGVFGTSSNQGKFTLQLQLRKYFLNDSYEVGQLGTEPSSLLFGFDDFFAYGYASHIKLDQMTMIELINEKLHEIDKAKKDIIIVGGQTGTIPVFSFNLQYFNLYTLNLLMGTNPDAIILCVNITDPIEYIARCIGTISNLMDCKIIALAVSPLTFKSNWEQVNGVKTVSDNDTLEKFKIQLKKTFGLNSYIIGTDEIQQLYTECINFFG